MFANRLTDICEFLTNKRIALQNSYWKMILNFNLNPGAMKPPGLFCLFAQYVINDLTVGLIHFIAIIFYVNAGYFRPV